MANKAGADLVVFPELSLSAYEPALAAGLALEQGSAYWQRWQLLSDELGISFAFGMPVQLEEGIVIGLFYFQPAQPYRVYAKHYLHPDEEPYFIAGTGWDGIVRGQQRLAFGICYELSVPAHAEYAHQQNVQIYVASVAKFENGIPAAHQRLAEIARQYSMHVLMSNAIGPVDNGYCTGQSAIWNPDGEMIAQLPKETEGLLLYDLTNTTITIT